MIFRLIIGIWAVACFANPFTIPFESKTELTNDDFLEVQQLIRQINIHPILHQNWRNDGSLSHYGDFWIRCSRGTRQELINPGKKLFPRQEFIKMGNGGNRCVVCCVPFRTVDEDHGTRARLASSIAEALSQTGFNGYFLGMIGGFPNPTGKEICYAGVPYSFKIFMMLEAYKRGFTNVLWIDSACLPLNDPTPLFDEIETTETVLHLYPTPAHFTRYIFDHTRDLLKNLTGTDVLHTNYLVSIVFGLKMDADRVKKLVEEYYAMVDIGWPFFSCFPEEFVLTAILGKPEYSHWGSSYYRNLLFTRSPAGEDDTQARLLDAKRAGYFFYQRNH